MITLPGLGSATADYAMAIKNKAQLSKLVNKDPEVSANVAYYKDHIGDVKSIDDLLKNRKLLTVALGAYGLASKVDAKGLLRKLLSEDPSASGSLAQRMLDPRYLSFAKAFASLKSDSGAEIAKPDSVNAVVAAYQEVNYEKAVGRTDTAARQALYFSRVAPQAAQSVYQVLSDKTLATVVREAYGLPKETGALDVAQQVRQLKAKGFDAGKLADPAYIKSILDRFLAREDAAGAPSGADEDVTVSSTGAAAASILANTVSSIASAGTTSGNFVTLDLSFLASGRFNIIA